MMLVQSKIIILDIIVILWECNHILLLKRCLFVYYDKEKEKLHTGLREQKQSFSFYHYLCLIVATFAI